MLASAVCAGLLARMAWDKPRLALPILLVLVLSLLPAVLARRRMMRLLRSGDVEEILGAWAPSMGRLVHPETTTPMLVATAYASHGFVAAARRALGRAARGPAWDAAVEQRLVLDTLLDTFEGEQARSLMQADMLEALPRPKAGYWVNRRVVALRRGVAALARAFAHRSRQDDLRSLRRAAKNSPLVHWAMLYGEAIVAIDAGDRAHAARLLAGAPAWPGESAFRSFHGELAAHMAKSQATDDTSPKPL